MPVSSRRGVALLICAVAVSVLLAAGCDDDDDDGELTATLRGVSASGTASFEAHGDGTEIEIQADDIPPGLHANHVHHGSCANEGEIHVPLRDLVADSDGDAEAETEWNDNDLGHFATGHYVDIHVRSTADGVGDVIVCGDVS